MALDRVIHQITIAAEELQGIVEGLRGGKEEAGEDSPDSEKERGGSRLRRLLPRKRERGAEPPGETESAEKESVGKDGDE